MNNRIYTKEVFEKEIQRLNGKIYCPNCHSSSTTFNESYFPCTASTKRGLINCSNCRSNFEVCDLLSLDDIREKKINEVLKNK